MGLLDPDPAEHARELLAAAKPHHRRAVELALCDLYGRRAEAIVRLPRGVERALAHRLLHDPRDLPLLLNFIQCGLWLAFSLTLQLTLLPRDGGLSARAVGLFVVHVVVTWAILGQRFILGMHFAAHRTLISPRVPGAALLNALPQLVLANFWGMPAGMYYLHHVVMHHASNNLFSWDLSGTNSYRRDSPLALLHYIANFALHTFLYLPYYAVVKRRFGLAGFALGSTGAYFAAFHALHAYHPAAFWISLGFSSVLGPVALMAGNFGQHQFINPADPADNYGLTVNLVKAPFNMLTFNDGYHIVHHLNSVRIAPCKTTSRLQPQPGTSLPPRTARQPPPPRRLPGLPLVRDAAPVHQEPGQVREARCARLSLPRLQRDVRPHLHAPAPQARLVLRPAARRAAHHRPAGRSLRGAAAAAAAGGRAARPAQKVDLRAAAAALARPLRGRHAVRHLPRADGAGLRRPISRGGVRRGQGGGGPPPETGGRSKMRRSQRDNGVQVLISPFGSLCMPCRESVKGGAANGNLPRVGRAAQRRLERPDREVVENPLGGRYMTTMVEVRPPRLELTQVEEGIKYVLAVAVRNTSARRCRVRIVPPCSATLRLSSASDVDLAPGLELRAELAYLTDVVEPLDDRLIVQASHRDDGAPSLITLPIEVRPRCAVIRCAVADIDFGAVAQGAPTVRPLELRNVGSLPGVVSLSELLGPGGQPMREGGTPPFRLLPARLEVAAGGSATARVECSAAELGEASCTLRLRVDDEREHAPAAPAVGLCAVVERQALELRDSESGEPLTAVSFGRLFYGLEARRVITAVNTGPSAVDFAFLNPSADADADETGTFDPHAASLSIEPAMGLLPPHGTCTIEAIFRPTREPNASSDAKGFLASPETEPDDGQALAIELQLESVETGQALALRLTGEGVVPRLSLSEGTLVFGDVPQYDYLDRQVTLRNQSTLPMDWSLSQPAHFSLTPSSGSLPAHGEAEVYVRFSPHQLGELKANARLRGFGGAVCELPLKLWGGCALPRRRVLEGGVDTLPEDFERPPRLVSGGTSSRPEWSRPALWESTRRIEESATQLHRLTDGSLRASRRRVSLRARADDDALDRIDQMDTGLELTSAEQLERTQHKQVYATFIARSREEREAARRARRSGIDPAELAFGVSLGLDPFSGLNAPWPEIDAPREPLWLERPYAAPGSQATEAGMRRPAIFDQLTLAPRKFKEVPESAEEIRECKQPLGPKELLSVACGPKTLDFGTVSAFTTVSRNFSVVSGLNASVLVEVKAGDEPELETSWPPSQVVPPEATAGFDITFRCGEPCTYRRTVAYVINGIHAFRMTVTAQVVPLELHLVNARGTPLEELEFSFGAGDAASSCSQSLVLQNRGTHPATFRWGHPRDFTGRSPYSVEPSEGVVPPKGRLPLSVEFEPQLGCHPEHALVCSVENGLSTTLLCRAPGLVEARLAPVEKTIAFGTIAIGTAQQRVTVLKNAGQSPAAFSFRPESLPAGVRLEPMSGVVPAGDVLEVAVDALIEAPARIEATIEALVRYGKRVQLPLSLEAIAPAVRLLEEHLEFGPVIVGSSAHMPVSLSNDSPVPAVIWCDLSAFPGFELKLRAQQEAEAMRAEMDAAEVSTTVTGVTGMQDDDEDAPLQLIAKRPDSAAGGENGGGEADGASSVGGVDQRLYRITVPPALGAAEAAAATPRTVLAGAVAGGGSPTPGELKLSLSFEPKAVGRVEFGLPLELSGVATTPNLRRLVFGEGLRARLAVSESTVQLGEVIVRDVSLPYTHEFTLISQDDEPLKWAIDSSALDGTGFSVPEGRGTLAPRETAQVLLHFAPQRPMPVDVLLPVIVDTHEFEPGANSYLCVRLRATAAQPRLEFDRSEVILPPVPLGHVSRACFFALNVGYDSLETRVRVAGDRLRMPLEVSFPEGRLVGIAKKRLLVMVSFRAQKPASFTTRLEFLDEDGYCFAIPVSATTDASILTTQPYVAGAEVGRLRWEAAELAEPRAGVAIRDLHEEEREAASPPRRGSTSPRRRSSTEATPVVDADATGAPAEAALEAEPSGARKTTGEATEATPSSKAAEERLLKLAQSVLHGQESTSTPRGSRSEEETTVAMAASVRAGGLLTALISSLVVALPSAGGSFPAALCASKGKAAIELVEVLSGKRVSIPQVAAADRKNAKQVARWTLGHFEALLSFLRGCGALLAPVKADHLLSLDDFMKLAEAGVGTIPSTAKGGRLSRRRIKSLTAEHTGAHAPSWVEVLFQVARALLFSRITPKAFYAQPFPLTMPDSALTALQREAPRAPTANAYSSSEALLLRWLEAHYALAWPDAPPLTIVDAAAALRDGRVFAAVISSHVPATAAPARPTSKGSFKRAAGPLATLSAAPCDEDGALSNVRAVLRALHELGVPFATSRADETDYAPALYGATARELLLLALHLHSSLPHLVPKTVITLAGGLHERVVKEIELSNPSRKPLEYEVRLDGAACFCLGDKTPTASGAAKTSLRLEPRTSLKVEVGMLSAFSGEMSGQLFFLSRGDGVGSSNASSLVFNLKAQVSFGQPHEELAFEARLYAPTVFQLTIAPPPQLARALEGGSVRVELYEDRPPLEAAQSPGSGATKRGGAPRAKAATAASAAVATAFDASDAARRLPKSFWTAAAGGGPPIKLDAKGCAVLPVQFVPFQLGEYSCTVWLSDATGGEWTYRLGVTAGLPLPIETVRFGCEMAQSQGRELALPYRNPQLEKAKAAVLDRSAKERELWSGVWGKEPIVRGQQQLMATSSSGAFSVPQKVDLFDRAGASRMASKAGSTAGTAPGTPAMSRSASLAELPPGANHLDLRFVPREAGNYSGEVLLVSPLDVRLYEVAGTASAPGIEAELVMSAPARHFVRQELPIVNRTDAEWTVTASLKGRGFSGPPSARVPAGETGHYPLEFAPDWTGTYDGSLVLTNGTTGDRYSYSLKGTGEEPLAEGHLVLECTARTPKALPVRVFNATADGAPCELRVDSDLLHATGPPTVAVPARGRGSGGGETTYELRVNAQMGGTIHGSVTFTAADGRFLWYTIEVRAAPPPAERTIEVSAPLRKVVAIEIPIANPSSSPLEIGVTIVGEALYGEASVSVPAGPGASSSYELFFSPLSAGTSSGYVAFVHEEVGEFWYELSLTGEAATPVDLPTLQCPIGSSVNQTFTITNPLGEPLSLKVALSDEAHWKLEPAGGATALALPPFGDLAVSLVYTASELDTPQPLTVSVSHPALGELLYAASGIGVEPVGAAPIAELASALGQPASGQIAFRNPFDRPLGLSIRLEQPQEGRFRLLRKSKHVKLEPNQLWQLPYAFQTDDIAEFSASIVLDGAWDGRPLSWTFPLKGVAVSRPLLRPITLRTKSRVPLSRELTLPLRGLELAEPERFSVRLDVAGDAAAAITSTLQVTPLTQLLAAPSLGVSLEWAPLRPARATGALVVTRASGGCWRYDVLLEAEDPEVEDVITIAAAINKPAAVSFTLENVVKADAPFSAFFTGDSPAKFAVSPAAGVLSGNVGTTFTVTYSPDSYGKPLRGSLVIDTEDVRWIYEVRGTLPVYNPPVARPPPSGDARLGPSGSHKR